MSDLVISDHVEFRHLKYIVAVAETANITRAAERLFLAQPSLSTQIKELEDVIGFPIFVRGNYKRRSKNRPRGAALAA